EGEFCHHGPHCIESRHFTRSCLSASCVSDTRTADRYCAEPSRIGARPAGQGLRLVTGLSKGVTALEHASSVGHPAPAHGAPHMHEHEEPSFLRKYVFSVDHKVIGLQYTMTALVFLMIGFTLMMIMRWQLAYPGQPIPLIGKLLGAANAPGGI